MPALSQRPDTPAGAWPRGGKHSPSCTVEQPQALLDQSVLLAGFVVTTRHTCGCLVVVASTLHPSASDSPSLTRARTLSRPPSCTVEWWRVCSISRSSRVRSSSFVNTKHPKVLARTALSTLHPSATSKRRACTLSLPPPCTVEQPQSLLDQSVLHAGSVAKARHTCRCFVAAASTLHPSATGRRQARTLSLPPSCTVEQPQSLLDQSELHGMSVTKNRHTCRCLVTWRQALFNRGKRRTRTLTLPQSCTVEQPQACSIRPGSMPAPSQRPDKPAGA